MGRKVRQAARVINSFQVAAEVENPKSETRNPKEIQNPKSERRLQN